MNIKVAGPFIFTLLLLCHLKANGQKLEDIDSLKTVLAQQNTDTAAVKILLSLSMKYQGLQTDSSMAYAVASLKKAETINFTKGRADALLQIGRLKRDQSNTAEALQEMFDALKLYREINDHVQIANSLNDISIIYANSGDFNKSLQYFNQALEIFRKMGDEKGESYALNNIGIIYQELKDAEKAKQYFLLSLKIKERNNDLYGISRGYVNLGSIAENNQQWNEALRYYLKADSLFENTNDIQAQGGNFIAIARVKDKQGKSAEARKFALMALETSKEVKALSSMLTASRLLAVLEEKRNNYKTSLEYQKLYNQIADSLNNEKHRANLEQLKAQFDFGEKEREIALLKKDKELQQVLIDRKNIIAYSLTGGIVLMALVLGLVFYAYRTTRSKKNTLAAKNREIQKQKDDLDKLNNEKDRFFSILSHDIRSPLNALKGFSYLLGHMDAMTTEELMQMKARIDKSLDNLTELINNILEWSMTSSGKRKWTFDRVNVSELIKKNISLYQSIAESKGVSLVYLHQDDLPAYADYYAIDTVIRNLLSNSIKFSHPESDVIIKVSKEADRILITFKDHGIGIPQQIQEKLFTLSGNITQPGTSNEKGSGLGLLLCKELLIENKGEIRVKSKPGEGSEFIVAIPEFPEKAIANIAVETSGKT